jgi:Uma2 family endonuclease
VYYPDVSVDCVPHGDDDLIVGQPGLAVEVTSPSTARIDRGETLDNYRRAASLRMCLVVDQRRRRVTCHRPDDAGAWVVEELTGTGTISVPCPSVELTLDEVYEGVEMPPLGVAEPERGDETGEYVVDW